MMKKGTTMILATVLCIASLATFGKSSDKESGVLDSSEPTAYGQETDTGLYDESSYVSTTTAPTPEITATPTPEATAAPAPEATAAPAPEAAAPTPEVAAAPTPEATAAPTPEATAAPAPEATAAPAPEATAAPTPEATAATTPEATAATTPEATAATVPENPSPDSSGNGAGNNNFNTYNNSEQQHTEDSYVLNTSSMKIHYPGCSSVPKIAPKNYATSNDSIEALKANGYSTCGQCFK